MYILALIGLIAAAVYFQRWLAKTQALSMRVRLTRVLRVAMPGKATRTLFREHLAGRGFVLRESEEIMDVLLRGDTTVRRVPAERNLSWREIPAMLVAGFGDEGGSTFIHLRFESFPGVTFSPAAMKTFCDIAVAECDSVVAWLNAVALEYQAAAAPSAPDVLETSHLDVDLAVLGLGPGASVEDVQAAYRAACLKFHPDRLAGNGASSATVEAASRKFQQATEAYRRAKAEIETHAA